MLDVVPVDFLVSTNNESYDEIIDALKVQDVTHVEVTTQIEYMDFGKWGTNDTTYGSLYGLRPGAEDYLVKILSAAYIMVEDITGDFNLTSGGIVLQDYQADELGVDVGDTIYLTYTSYWWNGTDSQEETRYHNMTVSGIVTFQLIETFGYVYNEPFSFFHIDDRSTIIEALNYTSPFYGIPDPDPFAPGYIYFSNYTFYVWADRDKLIAAGDIEKTKENYVIMERTLRNSLSNVLPSSEFSIETSPVILIMSGFDLFLMMLRLVFLGISLPAIALGVYLSLISIEVGMTRRNRELGILKARGATKGQLFGLLLTESLILGIIAGAIGLLLGVVASKIFLTLTPVASYFVENVYGIYISTTSLIIAVLFSIILIMIASYRPAKRITSQPGVEMLRYNPEGEVKTPYRPTIDILFVGIAVFTFALMFIVRSLSSGDMSMFAFLCMLNLALIFLTPISVFCFIIGVTRLLTRSTTKIYDMMSRAVKFITKDLWYI
ncbi:MAG: FtsX-like permease family protein, partial [Thermoplasmata archaeon]|nr:FtsX-like permease family protein [Thermoplasmata archaeon]